MKGTIHVCMIAYLLLKVFKKMFHEPRILEIYTFYMYMYMYACFTNNVLESGEIMCLTLKFWLEVCFWFS